jgi:hypothetical protein
MERLSQRFAEAAPTPAESAIAAARVEIRVEPSQDDPGYRIVLSDALGNRTSSNRLDDIFTTSSWVAGESVLADTTSNDDEDVA